MFRRKKPEPPSFFQFFLRPVGVVELKRRVSKDPVTYGAPYMVWEGSIDYQIWARGSRGKDGSETFEARVQLGYSPNVWDHDMEQARIVGVKHGRLRKEIREICGFFKEESGRVNLDGVDNAEDAVEAFMEKVQQQMVDIATLLDIGHAKKIDVEFPDVFTWHEEVPAA